MKKLSAILSAVLCALLIACLAVSACAEEIPTSNLYKPAASERSARWSVERPLKPASAGVNAMARTKTRFT